MTVIRVGRARVRVVGSGGRLVSAGRRGRGFSLLELMVVIVIIALLMAFAIDKLMALSADAERASMESVAGILRSAIGIKVAESIVRQEVAGLRHLAGSNPMDRLAEVPKNYLGELERPDPASLEDGHWYFDSRDSTLVYIVRYPAYFRGGLANPPRARFRVELVYNDRNRNGRFDHGTDAIEGLRMAPVEPYEWIK